MRLVVIIVAALTIVGVAALGLVLAQKGGTPSATAASTVRIASVTQDVPHPCASQSNCPSDGFRNVARHIAGQRRRASRQPNDDGHAGSVGGSGGSECQRPEPEHYFQSYDPRDHALEGRCHGVGTQIARA